MKKILYAIFDQLHALEQFIVDVVYDRPGENTLKRRFLEVVLLFFSLIFSAIVQVRYFLYSKRILKSQPLGCLVIVVGNVTVGGTGKTPIVEKLAKQLSQKGRNVAILSRGYKSKRESYLKRFWRWLSHAEVLPPKVVSDGKTLFLTSEEAGDEPYMLAKNLQNVKVVVDKNRVKAGYYAIKKYGVDTLILDDGFQYLPLKGYLNLLLIDKTNPFGNGRLLPRGILREPIKHIKRASYIFLTKSDGQESLELKKKILQYKPEASIIECRHKPTFFQALDTQERMDLESIKGKSIGVLSGIASPASFENFLEKMGATIVYKKRFLDHHRFSKHDLQSFLEEAQKYKAEYIILTEKDAVRLPEDLKWPIPIFYLRIEIEILKDENILNELLDRILNPCKTSH